MFNIKIERMKKDIAIFWDKCFKRASRKCRREIVPALYRYRGLLIALIAYYLLLSDRFDQFLQGLSSRRVSLRLRPRRTVLREAVQSRYHEEYITDQRTAFLKNAPGCHEDKAGANMSQSTVHHALFLVCTAVPNVENRQHMREIYGNLANTRPYRIRVSGWQLLGVVRLCFFVSLSVELILKIDDDVFVDVFKFFELFRPIVSNRKRTLHCYLNFEPQVFRQGKYRVSEEEFAGSVYPNFCSGFFVVPTVDILDDLYDVSKIIRFFRLEDVFTYGVVRHAMVDVQAVHVDVVTHEWGEYRRCVEKHR
ncbi:uncharacterized protein LOC101855935 [Aplysia californica]|uniref:Hexosyltransferase n=1 Tax=Aplysia californica TaxID=6500 RepID=A0ABM1VQL9_APLCA|nr:uncharacterized protein LOC101855935 [Aplysia californica]